MWIGNRTAHRPGLLLGAVALIVSSLLLITGRASADEIFWVNQNSVAYSQLDDSAGAFLPSSVNAVHGGMGAAIDTANSRIYIAQEANNQIVWFGLDGTSAGVVKIAAGSVDHPVNLTIDPETQTLYWANAVSPGSIGFARVDESESGILVHAGSTGAHVEKPTRLALDTRHERLYWWNEAGYEFSWATTDGLIGGNLKTPGLESLAVGQMGGIAIEPYSTPEEIYFVNIEANGIFHTDPLLGGEPERLHGTFTENNANGPTGLAFDWTDERFYWANQGVDEERTKAIGTATLFGNGTTLSVFPVAPVHSPVFATILKAPNVESPPHISLAGTTLSCTQGEWEGDHPGASVFAAPTSLSFQWKRGSATIAGATGTTYTATESGGYGCEVVAENAAGQTVSKSSSITVTFPPKPKTTTPSTSTNTPKSSPASTPATAVGSATLALSGPVKVMAGGTAVVGVDLVNSGKAAMGSTKVCGQLTKQAKKGLKTPACVTVKSVAAGKTVVAKLKVKSLTSAHGTYKFTVAMSGALTASLTAKVQVRAKKTRR